MKLPILQPTLKRESGRVPAFRSSTVGSTIRPSQPCDPRMGQFTCGNQCCNRLCQVCVNNVCVPGF
jgi:hypothetical protein